MGSKEKIYRRNRKRVYDIYQVPHRARGNSWDTHHIVHRSEGGGDEKENLFPSPKKVHKLFHRRGVDNGVIHDFCEREYGGDPYKR